jgi:nucleoside 2-deoxyribosyltransferase
MKVYIAGPISGVPDHKERFAEAERFLKGQGYDVVNPALTENSEYSYKDYIDSGLRQLSECDALCTLPGFENSKGALLERAYALVTGKPVMNIGELRIKGGGGLFMWIAKEEPCESDEEICGQLDKEVEHMIDRGLIHG